MSTVTETRSNWKAANTVKEATSLANRRKQAARREIENRQIDPSRFASDEAYFESIFKEIA